MASSWLRLWHDMPNDPKWRTIARLSGQPISLVQAVYIHILVNASQNVTRGHASVTHEDLASALDVTEDEIGSIFDAMQGRVLDGYKLTGWESRQPKREDLGDAETGAKSAAERKRAQREREKESACNDNKMSCHDLSRDVTLDTDTDTEKEQSQKIGTPEQVVGASPDLGKLEPKPHNPVNGSAISLKTFLARCKAAGERPIGDYRPVWEYAEKVGLHEDSVVLCWQEFTRKFGNGGGRDTKRYRDWRRAFRNCVEDNWFGLWTLDEQGRAVLTARGRIAEKVAA